jgi:mannose-1-phosphate guanylyltransferase/mannose-1-phosphate guanylyltransferase/mannose-6-phosphate isomerase
MNATSPARKIRPVLLSGGSGTRLWPLSREGMPKQLLPLVSDLSLLQETAMRVADRLQFSQPIVIANQAHADLVAGQLRGLPGGPADIHLVLEPMGRNTAPAIAVAALLAAADDPQAIILVLPADHLIGDLVGFRQAVEDAGRAAAAGALVTFGIVPDRPETGYGYIRRGEGFAPADGCWRVAGFVEKPDLATAEGFVAGGKHLFNSGMFVLPAARVLEELERHEPGLVPACRQAIAEGRDVAGALRLDAAAFVRAPSISIDYAVMERTADAVVVPVDIGWSDIGSWSALWELTAKDAAGNAVSGDVLLDGASGCHVVSRGATTAVIGIADAVVVVTPDAVLVARRDRVQDVKGIVARLKARSGGGDPSPI